MTAKWSRDWISGLQKWLTEHGYSSLGAFLRSRQAITYHKLADEIGEGISAAQIWIAQFTEARSTGNMKEAVQDSLVRNIHNQLARGWRKGFHWDYKVAGVIADWLTMIKVDGQDEEAAERAQEIWNRLLSMDIPEGWLPESNDDPHILDAIGPSMSSTGTAEPPLPEHHKPDSSNEDEKDGENEEPQ